MIPKGFIPRMSVYNLTSDHTRKPMKYLWWNVLNQENASKQSWLDFNIFTKQPRDNYDLEKLNIQVPTYVSARKPQVPHKHLMQSFFADLKKKIRFKSKK